MAMRGTAVISGVAELRPMLDPGGRTAVELLADVSAGAMSDAGLDPADVDGLLVAPRLIGTPLTMPSAIAEYLGLQPTYCDVVDIGGATAAGMVWRAAAALRAGACRAVLCALADTVDPRSFYTRPIRWDGMPGAEFERPFGPLGATSGYALAAQRHAFQFGTTDEQRAKVAVDQRANACANPNALFYGKPITLDDVMASRMISDPLRLLEIVRPCSGGTAFVVTTPDIARRSPHPAVTLLGFGEKVTHAAPESAPDLTTTGVAVTAPMALEMAGVTVEEIDVVSIYDCFTITVLITLEDAGFCKKGDGGPFVAEHDLTFKGDLPVNPHGGQLSYGQAGLAGGASHVSEAVFQLRGAAGERQVPDAELAFVNGNGGILSEQCSLVLGREG
jgi:acetyl-CoA acetyltransferase